MRILFIAMSGVRVCNPELLAAGLTLPGFVERSEVIASLPSLSLLTLAALTPDDIEIAYHEIAEFPDPADLPGGFDLVAISTMTAQAKEAYAIARHYRDAGTQVVLGGLHATAVPEEALQHCTAVVAGEGEPVWAQILDDARTGRLGGIYRPGTEFDLAATPIPRYDLLDVSRYNRLTVQTTRGCPHSCEFCASSITLTPKYKVKPVARVIEEIRAIKRIWPHPFIEFADDNSFAQRGHAKELLRALAKENIRWFTEVDQSIARDPEMLELMRGAGCRQVLIGLESPVEDGLVGIEGRADWKLRQFPRSAETVRTIQSHGITVIGCFILGLDGHTPRVFDEVHDFAQRTSLYDVQVTVLTPFPGTPMYERFEREGRLTHPGAWERCTLFDVNYEPTHMSAAELESGFLGLVKRLYAPDAVRARREGYFRSLRTRRRRCAG